MEEVYLEQQALLLAIVVMGVLMAMAEVHLEQ
jgi:hypothetical protein